MKLGGKIVVLSEMMPNLKKKKVAILKPQVASGMFKITEYEGTITRFDVFVDITVTVCASLKHASRLLGKEGKYRKPLLNMEDIIIIM